MMKKIFKMLLAYAVIFSCGVGYNEKVLANDYQEEINESYERSELFEIDTTGEIFAYNGPVPAGDLIIPEGVTSFKEGVLRGKGITSIVLPTTMSQLGEFSLADNNITKVVLKGATYNTGFYDNWLSNQVDVNETDIVFMESLQFDNYPEVANTSIGIFNYITDKQPVCQTTGVNIYAGIQDESNVFQNMKCSDPEGKQVTFKDLSSNVVFDSPGLYFTTIRVADEYQYVDLDISVKVYQVSEKNDFVISEDGYLLEYTGSEKDLIVPEGVTRIEDDVLRNKGISTIVLPKTLEHVGWNAFADNYIQKVIFKGRVYSSMFGDNWISNQKEVIQTEIVVMEATQNGSIEHIADNSIGKFTYTLDKKPVCNYASVPYEMYKGVSNQSDVYKKMSCSDPEGKELTYEDYYNEINYDIPGEYFTSVTVSDGYQESIYSMYVTVLDVIEKDGYYITNDGLLVQYLGNDVDLVVPEGVTSIADEVLKNKGIKSIILPSTLDYIGNQALAENNISKAIFKGTVFYKKFGNDWISNQKGVSSTEIVLIETVQYNGYFYLADNSVGNFVYTIDKQPVCENTSLRFVAGKASMNDVFTSMSCKDPEGKQVNYKVINSNIDFNTPGLYMPTIEVSDEYQIVTYSFGVRIISNTENDGWYLKNNNKWEYIKNGVAVNGWQSIEGLQYYFENSEMVSDWWLDKNTGAWYFFNGGVMQRTNLEINGRVNAFDTYGVWQGIVHEDGWELQSNNKWKYYKNNKAVNGWQSIDGLQYYFENSDMVSDWWLDKNTGAWYFFNGGVMQRKNLIINGKVNIFDTHGVWKGIAV